MNRVAPPRAMSTAPDVNLPSEVRLVLRPANVRAACSLPESRLRAEYPPQPPDRPDRLRLRRRPGAPGAGSIVWLDPKSTVPHRFRVAGAHSRVFGQGWGLERFPCSTTMSAGAIG